MLAAFARASGSSQRARLAASALTRRVSSAAEPISSASSNSAALARSTRLFSRSFASADGGSASKLNAAPARPPVKQLPAQTTRSEERELSEAEARFIETLQYMDGVRAKSKTATQQLASKKAPSGGAASGSGKGGAAGGASGSSNNDDPPPVPVAGEKYKGKMTKHLFARRKSLEDYPGATEMVVPVDNIVSSLVLCAATRRLLTSIAEHSSVTFDCFRPRAARQQPRLASERRSTGEAFARCPWRTFKPFRRAAR